MNIASMLDTVAVRREVSLLTVVVLLELGCAGVKPTWLVEAPAQSADIYVQVFDEDHIGFLRVTERKGTSVLEAAWVEGGHLMTRREFADCLRRRNERRGSVYALLSKGGGMEDPVGFFRQFGFSEVRVEYIGNIE